MRIRQSVCYPMVKPDNMPLEDLFRTAAEIGFEAVELWGRGADFEDVAALAKRHNLAIATMCAHASLREGVNNRANHERIEGEIRESLQIAARHGIPGLICLAGNRVEGQPDEEAIEVAAGFFRRMAPHAEKAGVNLNLELLNSKVDHPGYQCDSSAWGLEVVRRVASPRVKLLYDIYHMQIMEGDVIRTITANTDAIGHFHTAGNPGRADLDDSQELNYRGIMRAIAKAGYRYFVGHEFRPKGDVAESLRSAFETCDQG